MSTARQKEMRDAETDQNSYGQERAQYYDKECADNHYYGPKITAQKIDELFGENKDVLILDAGAGTGLVGDELKNLGFTNMVALDGSPDMLEVANQKGVYKKSICSLLGPDRLDIDSGQYDCVVCVGTMAADHANAGCLPELIRITKPGGYVVIATREALIPVCGYDGKSWDDWLKIHEGNGLWKKVEIRRVENWLAGFYVGLIYVYQVV